MARWRVGVCPITAGQPAGINKFVTQRIKQIAAMVGAPVQGENLCKPNVDIVFTNKPQELLDDVRKNHPLLLGYHHVLDLKRVAKINHPIQAWYTTGTEDYNGTTSVDNEMRNRGVDVFSGICGCFFHLVNAREESVEGTRLGDGLRSEFFHISLSST